MSDKEENSISLKTKVIGTPTLSLKNSTSNKIIVKDK